MHTFKSIVIIPSSTYHNYFQWTISFKRWNGKPSDVIIMLAKDQQNNYRRFREQDLRIPSANPLPSHSNFNSQDEGAFCSSKLVDRFVVRCISTPFLIFLGCVFARAQPIRHSIFAINGAAAGVEVVCACDLSRARCNVDRDVLFSHKAN